MYSFYLKLKKGCVKPSSNEQLNREEYYLLQNGRTPQQKQC